MRLTDLIGGEGTVLAQGEVARNVDITGLASDSREVRPGYLFAALPGHAHDGRAFIADAARRGASAFLAPTGTLAQLALREVPGFANLPVIEDAEPRRRFALMAARFYGAQPDVVAAVTGTNGKTSVASFTRQIWTHLGRAAASLGTLGVSAPGIDEPGSLTTPDPARLHETLARIAHAGATHLCMEASSHGIEQFRLDGVHLTAAAFTNLTRDHLDYHGTEENYFAAKARLFSELLPAGGFAVINADIPQYAALATIAARRGQRVIGYGANGDDIRLRRTRAQGLGQMATVTIAGRDRDLHVPLVGGFQLHNVACAVGLAIATGASADDALDAVGGLKGAPGRMELVGTRANGAAVFVDYAHTPDALANVLASLRPHARGRLVVVFGCGGDRDRGKRPEMGHIASQAADDVFVTDDNPRTEDAAAIRRDVLAGTDGHAREIGDRGEAIREAVRALEPGDVLVVAGKGHERGQIVGDRVLPFFDADAVGAAIADSEDRR
ncbi:MAG: UDP-N-acetylmuramoyl-L-alanyl-D-glutamate--2,6-diaminopimelate ligase [Alphaproteobacteria bacterium]